jgi:ketosteroid isomerase-like protein
MMIKPLIFAAALTVSSFVSASIDEQAPRSPLEVSLAFERHFNAGDLKALSTLYREGSIFVAAPGVQLKGDGPIREALAQFMAVNLPIKLTVRQVYQTEETALVIFEWVIKGQGADGKVVNMVGTGADVVTRQVDGTWKYAIDNPFGVSLPVK